MFLQEETPLKKNIEICLQKDLNILIWGILSC